MLGKGLENRPYKLKHTVEYETLFIVNSAWTCFPFVIVSKYKKEIIWNAVFCNFC